MASAVTSTSSNPVIPVEVKDLPCSEYCHLSNVNFTQKPKDDKTVKEIIRTITAQMNASGGVVIINGITRETSLVLDTWKQGFEDQLVSVIPNAFPSRIKLVDKYSNGSQKICIISKKSAHLITYEYWMFTRKVVSTLHVKDVNSAVAIMRQKPSNEAPFILPQLEFNRHHDLKEGQNVEFKCWKTKTVEDIIRKLNDNRSQNGMFAMPNLPSGGWFIIGISEDQSSKKVITNGQLLDEKDEEKLTLAIEQLMSADPSTGVSRIWGKEGTTPSKGKHWDVNYHKLKNCPANERRVLIVIKLGHCPGGVFMKPPAAYTLDDNGERRDLTFSEWHSSVFRISVSQSSDVKRKTLKKAVPSTRLSSGQRPKSSGKVRKSHTHHMAQSETNDILKGKAKKRPVEGTLLATNLDVKSSLSWSKDNKEWKQGLEFDDTALESVVASVEDIFQSERPLRFIPDQKTIVNSHPKYKKQLRACMQHIVAGHGSRKGFVIASKQWIKQISTLHLDKPRHHMIDFMSMDDKCCMKFVSTFEKKDCEEDTAIYSSYVNNLARLTKRHILNHKDCKLNDEESISIETGIWILHEGIYDTPGSLSDECKKFLSGNADIKVIQNILGMLLLSKDTIVKKNVGNQCLITLTLQQMESLLTTDISKFNFIEGPPGSGKTLLALYVCGEFEKDKCHILCKNPSLKAYFDFQQTSAKATVIEKDDDLISFMECDEFCHLECVIIDDCHYLDFDGETWIKLFQSVKEYDMYLFVFMDNNIQNFLSNKHQSARDVFEAHRKDLEVSHQIKTLSKVHRNTQKVVSFINAGFKQQVKCGHMEEGDDVELRQIANIKFKGTENGLLHLFNELLGRQQPSVTDITPYETVDIAVLIDGENIKENILFYTDLLDNHLPEANVQPSNKFPVQGIVVDDVDTFAGLDAKVCIVLIPDVSSESGPTETRRHFSNPKYKAFLASRGIYRIIFVTESSMDFNRVDDMYIPRDPLVKDLRRSFQPDYQYTSLRMTYDKPGSEFDLKAVAICPVSGNIFVTDTSNNMVHILDPRMKLVRVLGQGRNQLRNPEGMAVDNQGTIYVVERENNRIQVLDQEGNIVSTIGRQGSNNGSFKSPSDVAIDEDNQLYVSDYGNSRVQILSCVGNFVRKFKLQSAAPRGRTPRPEWIAVNGSHVAVADAERDVHLLTRDGVSVMKIQHDPTVSIDDIPRSPRPGMIAWPRGLAFDNQDNLVIADVNGRCIHVLLKPISGCAKRHVLGISELASPSGISVTKEGYILVCDKPRLLLFASSKLMPSNT